MWEETSIPWATPRDIDGRVAFKAVSGDREFIINEKGGKVAGDYEYVSIPQNIHGTIAFWAREGAEGFFVVNEKGDRDPRFFDEIFRMRPLPGGAAYVIARNDNCYVKEIIDAPFFR